MSEEVLGTAPIPAPGDGAEDVGGAAPGPGYREAGLPARSDGAARLSWRGRGFVPHEARKRLYVDVLRLSREGYGYKRIAGQLLKKYGVSVSQSTISYWVRGIYTPYYRRFPDKERVSFYYASLKLHAEGYDCKTIANELRVMYGVRVDRSTIKAWVAGKYSPYGPEPPELPTPKTNNTHHCARPMGLRPNPELAYLIGATLGDGCATRHEYEYSITLQAKDKDFVEEFAKCLTGVLGRRTPVKVRFWRTRELFVAKAASRTLHELLRKPVNLSKLRKYVEHCDRCSAAFIRGFADAEGSIDRYGRIVIINTDVGLLTFVKELLKRLGIESSDPLLKSRVGDKHLNKRGEEIVRRKPCYKLYIRAHGIPIFCEKIGFTIKRKQKRLERHAARSAGATPPPIFPDLY